VNSRARQALCHLSHSPNSTTILLNFLYDPDLITLANFCKHLILRNSFYLFFSFVVLGLELRAYTLSHSTSPFL
jgi:hypothetical protein